MGPDLFELVLIGGWRVSVDGHPVHLPPSAQRLLAFIALNDRPNRALAAGVLWPDVSEDRAQASLRTAVWRVVRGCPGLLRSDQDVLALSDRTSVDVWRLRALHHALVGEPDGVPGSEWRSESLWADLLPGWYDDWVLLERERLRQLRLYTLETMTRRLARSGRYGEALEIAMAAVSVAPLRESAHREIIRIHLAEGNVAEALRQYEVCAQLLRSELGLEPSEQTVDLMGPIVSAGHRPAPRPGDQTVRWA